jgi:hypothetical protein
MFQIWGRPVTTPFFSFDPRPDPAKIHLTSVKSERASFPHQINGARLFYGRTAVHNKACWVCAGPTVLGKRFCSPALAYAAKNPRSGRSIGAPLFAKKTATA